MTTTELIIRTIACTASFILAIALVRTREAVTAARCCGAGLCLGLVAYIVCSGSGAICSSIWWMPAQLLAAGIPFFFWAWTGLILNDEFSFSALPLVGGVLLVAPPLVNYFAGPAAYGAMVIAHSLLGLAFVAGVLVNVLRGWRQDLVESRRRLRFLIVAVSGIYIVIVLGIELVLRDSQPHEWLFLINAIFLSIIVLGITVSVLELSDAARTSFGWNSSRVSLEVAPASVAVRDREQELIDRLTQLMTANAAYRDSSVTIAMLASRLGVTEKKLRETINHRLGFKNYSSFVNAFRLEEVRRRLHDPKQAEIPILSMALEAGFGSIVAFNRAFKDKFAVTPSAYRSQAAMPVSKNP